MKSIEWLDELKALMDKCPKECKAIAIAFDDAKMLRASSNLSVLEYMGFLEMESRNQQGLTMGTLKLPEAIERYRVIDAPEKQEGKL